MTGLFGYTGTRSRIIDYPFATTVIPMVVMIPKPTAQKLNRIYAISLPFQPIVITNCYSSILNAH